MILAGTLPEICQPKTDMSLAPRGALFTEPDTLRNIYKNPLVAEAVQPAVRIHESSADARADDGDGPR